MQQVRGGNRGAEQGVEKQPPVAGQVGVHHRELRNVVGDLADHGEHQHGGDRADRVLGEGRDRQPDGAECRHGRGHVQGDEEHPQQPLPEPKPA